MSDAGALIGIVAALTIGVISPGPSFVLVARTAVAGSRGDGLAAALGMGVGGLAFGVAALLGLQGVLLAVPAAYLALKVLGGLYLCWLGWQIFRAARMPLAIAPGVAQQKSGRRAFVVGLGTQLSNPKTAIVYASVFAAFLPPSFSPGFAMALLVTVFCVEASWYALVALLLSASRPQQAYLAGKHWIDRTAGAVMLGLGLKLISSAVRS